MVLPAPPGKKFSDAERGRNVRCDCSRLGVLYLGANIGSLIGILPPRFG
jgi:hypothetical protein